MNSKTQQEEKRRIWMGTRSVLESDNYKHKRYGGKSQSHWTLFEHLADAFGVFLKVVGLYNRGVRNARNVQVNELEIAFDHLPSSFHGYRILHMTDLHLDCIKGIEEIICERIAKLNYDLCVITGDYREKTHGGYKHILPAMKTLVKGIHASNGILATLGNHDTYLMAFDFENMGVRVLGNETIAISKEGDNIKVTGIDDPHHYYTDQALCTLEEDHPGFKIVLVHSPDVYDLAADNGYSLYLCGHTHGGQIALPRGIPLITHIHNGKKFYRGLWQYKKMKGYTGQGSGAVAIPVRFNTQSEVTLITLKKRGMK